MSIRASASLSSLFPPSDWRERKRRRREHGYITNTHIHTLVTLRCGSGAGAVGSRVHGVFPLLPSFFDCFLWFSFCFCFYPSSSEQLRGCIFKHHGVSLRCLSPKYLLVLKNPNNNCVFFHLHIHHLISFPFSSSYFPPPSNLSTRTLKDARSFVSGTTEEISSLTFLNVLFHVESFLRERGGRRVLTSNRKKEKSERGEKRWWWDFNSWFVPPFYVFLMTLRRALDFSFRPLCISLFLVCEFQA